MMVNCPDWRYRFDVLMSIDMFDLQKNENDFTKLPWMQPKNLANCSRSCFFLVSSSFTLPLLCQPLGYTCFTCHVVIFFKTSRWDMPYIYPWVSNHNHKMPTKLLEAFWDSLEISAGRVSFDKSCVEPNLSETKGTFSFPHSGWTSVGNVSTATTVLGFSSSSVWVSLALGVSGASSNASPPEVSESSSLSERSSAASVSESSCTRFDTQRVAEDKRLWICLGSFVWTLFYLSGLYGSSNHANTRVAHVEPWKVNLPSHVLSYNTTWLQFE